MSTALSGQTVLIIGGSSGIGFGVAQALVRENANIIISSSQQTKINAKIKQLKEEFPNAKGTIKGYACNLKGPEMDANIEKLFQSVGPTLDHVIHTAGDALKFVQLQDLTYESLKAAADVRFYSVVFVVKHAIKVLPKNKNSSITLTTGTASVRPQPGWGITPAFGAGLQGLTRSLAVDLAPIRVNLTCPGAVLTELWDGLTPEKKEAFLKGIEGKLLTGAIGTPEDLAETYLYAMKCKFMTGEMLKVDGGGVLV